MAARATKSRSFKIAYILDHKGYDRIVGILNELYPDLSVSIGCSDGSSVQFSMSNELLDFTNAESRQIRSLSIRTPWDKEPNIRVKFGSSKYETPVEYEISGDDKSVFYYSGKLDECISTYRLWYTSFAFLDFIDIAFFCIMLIIPVTVLGILYVLWGSDLSQPLSKPMTRRDIYTDFFLNPIF